MSDDNDFGLLDLDYPKEGPFSVRATVCCFLPLSIDLCLLTLLPPRL